MADITIGNELKLSGDINIGGGGGGGSTRWGKITGNMENQTDLMEALASKRAVMITLTGDNVTSPTYAEILAAYNDGQPLYYSDSDGIVPLTKYQNGAFLFERYYTDISGAKLYHSTASVIRVSGTDDGTSLKMVEFIAIPTDAVTTQQLQQAILDSESRTSMHIDSVYMTLNQDKANKALVATFTRDAETEQWSCDKTAGEIYEAYTNGQLVLAKLNNRRAVFNLSSMHREEVPDIAAGAYGYEIWFSAVFGEVMHQLYYSYQPTGVEDSEIVYETFAEYTPREIPSISSLPLRVTFETEGSSYISWEDFDAVKASFDDGAEVYAVLDGWEYYTFGTIEMESGIDAGTMYFSRVEALGSSITFKAIAWHHESGADDRITLTTKTLAAWEGGNY